MGSMIRLLPHAFALVMLVLLLRPGGDGGGTVPINDKLLHLGFFLVWVGLWRACDPPHRPALVALVVVAMAAGSELAQHWLAHRSGDWLDFGADLVGAAGGWWIGGLRPIVTKNVKSAINY